MFSAALLQRFDARRVRLLLGGFFLLLAIPSAVLIWQAYSQLKWEAYYQYRNTAEELTRSIDARLRERIAEAEARSFADYSFLVLAGDPSANFVQRSPLAAHPVESALPGTIGYFQVDAQGGFSTPLLPARGTEPSAVGIDGPEYAERFELAGRLHDILSDNRLVRSPASPSRAESGDADESTASEEGAAADRAVIEGTAARPAYSQRNFDELGRTRAESVAGAVAARQLAAPGDDNPVADLVRAYPDKVSELEERQDGRDRASQAQLRSKRIEQISLPEAAAPSESAPIAADANRGALRVSTFESEVDPFEFGMLDSGHFVLFRNVWREGQRYVQGILIDRGVFLAAAIGDRFASAALAGMSDLAVTYHDEVLMTSTGANAGYVSASDELAGTLLYGSRLSAPLDSLGLVFSIRQLPPGAGAGVLVWVSLLVAATLVGGFVGLYRLAMSQLRLARQQQDFVSAVSHELKTPLTSIRMYGEMLREGWAPAEKRQQYYEYIHDESERLTRLISNVLRLASITRNEPQLAMRPVTVRELLNGVEPKFSSQVRRAGFEVAYERDPRAEEVTVCIDEDCFLQIVINLVDNAIKFSADASRKVIEIGSRLTSDGTVAFSVRDFGPGVPRNQMRKIFELFYRPEGELTRETVGTGIGLAIVHQLCVAMNGQADVINRAPGAEFRVTFPTD